MIITIKELKKYRKLKKEIPLLKDQIKELEVWLNDAAPGIPNLNGMPTTFSIDPDKTGQTIIRINDLKKRYVFLLHDALNLLTDIEIAISSLDENERLLLRLRYLQGKGWVQIAAILGYQIRNVFILHSKIIKKLAKK